MTLDTRIKEVFADAFELTPAEVNENMTIENTAGWDSMRSITLSFSLEQAFAVEFNDNELLMIESYKSVRELLVNKGVT
jgi:acyl carrier protein